MESEKEASREGILEAEQEVQDLEDELFNRSRGKVVHYEDCSIDELEDALNAAQNNFNYLTSCWDSDYPGEDF